MGARVVVRRRLEAEETTAGGHVWTDVIGIVLATGSDGLLLRPDAPRRRPRPAAGAASGSAAQAGEVFVPAASIEAAKRIGPRPAPRPR